MGSTEKEREREKERRRGGGPKKFLRRPPRRWGVVPLFFSFPPSPFGVPWWLWVVPGVVHGQYFGGSGVHTKKSFPFSFSFVPWRGDNNPSFPFRLSPQIMTTIGILGTTHKAAAYKKGRRLPTGTHLVVCIATLCHADTRPRSSVKEATKLVATALSESWLRIEDGTAGQPHKSKRRIAIRSNAEPQIHRGSQWLPGREGVSGPESRGKAGAVAIWAEQRHRHFCKEEVG